jgi:hypothetical protein
MQKWYRWGMINQRVLYRANFVILTSNPKYATNETNYLDPLLIFMYEDAKWAENIGIRHYQNTL